MLPTTPLRSLKTIRNSIKIAKKYFRNVFSVTQYDFHVSFAINIQKKMTWKPLFPRSPVITGNTQSQNQKKIFLSYRCNRLHLVKKFKKNEYSLSWRFVLSLSKN